MQLDSARELKAALQESVIVPMATSFLVKSAGVRAQPTSALSATPPTMALGVVPKGEQDFGIAVRVQKRGLENSPQVESIKKKARGEVDVRYIGEVTKRGGPALVSEADPAAPSWRFDRSFQYHRRDARLFRPQSRRRLGADPVEQPCSGQ
jgi:hypothetical protein